MIDNSNIYKILGHEDFFNSLTSGIIERVSNKFNIKDVIILLPTQQSCSTLSKEFSKINQELPQIHSISDLSSLIKVNSQNQVLNRFDLIIKINELILAENIPGFNSLISVVPISEYLANLIYKLELHEINLNEVIKFIDENIALHQQQLFNLVSLFIKKWQKSNYITKAGLNNLLIEKFTQKLAKQPIIIAGISTNIPSILKLMSKIHSIKNGYIVFYGVDNNLTEDDLNNLDPCHNQYNFKQIFNRLNIKLDNIKHWLNSKKDNNFTWLSKALLPTKSCVNWYIEKEAKIHDWKYLVCPDQHFESKAIIDIIKANQDKSIMIVTPDESLIIKIMLNLKANNIAANIIRDYPLNKTNSAIWLNLCLEFINNDFSSISALSLLKHNLSKIPLEIVTQAELILRDKSYTPRSILDIDIEDDVFNQFIDYAKTIKEFLLNSKHQFSQILKTHLEFAKTIAKEDLWNSPENEELKIFFDRLQEIAESFGYVSCKDYAQILDYFLKSAYYRPENSNHSITLSKPIDARLHKAELMILAGMNENIWPSLAANDPCFSNNLLKKIGLPGFEDNLGEESYDFYCFAQTKKVVVTRAEKISGTLTIPSRWLLRILTFTKNMNSNIQYTHLLQESAKPIIEDFVTSPIPPLKYRPLQLSVTQIDKLIFNPYHIYVDLILKLKKLPSLKKELTSLDFGIFVHKALELYYNNNLEQGKLQNLLNAGKKALSELNLHHDQLELIYWARFVRIAKWFIANENQNNKLYLEISGKLKLADNFILTARADRIEISQDNKIHIVDYKTGRLSSLKSILQGKNLQLLLEGLIAKNGGFYFQKSAQKLGSLTYIQLSGGEDPVETLEIDLDVNQIIEKTDIYVHELIEDYHNPITPYHYTNKKKLGYCEYSHLARIFD